MIWKKNRRKIRFSPRKLLIGLFLTILVALVYFLVLYSGLLNVKNQEIEAHNLSCVNQNQIEQEMNLVGKNIITISQIELENQLKDKYFCIKRVEVRKNLNKISIKVLPREARLQIVSREVLGGLESSQSANLQSDDLISDERSYLVDEEGIVFTQSSASGIPKVVLFYDLKVGDKLDSGRIQDILNIFASLKDFGIEVWEAKIVGWNILITQSSPRFTLDLSANISKQLASLQLILGVAKIDGEMELVDLRFEKPVIKYVPKK